MHLGSFNWRKHECQQRKGPIVPGQGHYVSKPGHIHCASAISRWAAWQGGQIFVDDQPQSSLRLRGPKCFPTTAQPFDNTCYPSHVACIAAWSYYSQQLSICATWATRGGRALVTFPLDFSGDRVQCPQVAPHYQYTRRPPILVKIRTPPTRLQPARLRSLRLAPPRLLLSWFCHQSDLRGLSSASPLAHHVDLFRTARVMDSIVLLSARPRVLCRGLGRIHRR